MEEAISHRQSFGGVWIALLSAALFGASTPLAKLLIGGGFDPWLLAGLLYLGSGCGLAAAQAVRSGLGLGSGEAPLRRADLPWLLLVVLSGGVAGPVLLMIGLAETDAAAASLLLNLEGLATLAIAWLVFHENVDRRVLVGAFAILLGAGLLSWRGGPGGIGPGAIAIAAACLAWAIDNNLTRKLSAADPVAIAMIKGLAAGLVNVLLALLLHRAAWPPWPAIGAALMLGFVGYGISLVLFVMALRQLGAARTGAYFATAPFIGALLALGLLQEPLTPLLLAAGGLIAVGLYLHVTERHEHEHLHEAIEHEHRHRHDAAHGHAHLHEADDPRGEPHSHRHRHRPLVHRHPHYPDLHHGHSHRHGSSDETRERPNS